MHAQFVCLHIEIKVCLRKSPNTSKFSENSSCMNLSTCAKLLADNFTDSITVKNENLEFFWLSDLEKLKNYLVGWWTQPKDIFDASLIAILAGNDPFLANKHHIEWKKDS